MTEDQELFWNILSKDYPLVDDESRNCKNCIHEKKVIGKIDGSADLSYPCNICAPLGSTDWITYWVWNGKNIHGVYDD